MSYIKGIFDEAQKKAEAHAIKTVGDNVMIYPCGFAWVEISCRKNSVIGKELESSEVFKWDGVEKCYNYWVGEYNQSMLHKKAHAEKLAEILSNELFIKFEARYRMD